METKFQKRLKHLFTIGFLFISFVAVSMVFSKGEIVRTDLESKSKENSEQPLKYKLHFFKPI